MKNVPAYQRSKKWINYFIFIATLSFLSCATENEILNHVDFVDPYIGSGGHGHVFVGASVPFGAVQVGPNNIYKGWDWCSGYHYSDSLITGFSQLHLSGTGIGDLGDILIMPYTGDIKLDKGKQEFPHDGYLSTFSHDYETVRPGYYSVEMDNDVKVELTATERVAFHRYYFPKGKKPRIIIDLSEGINDSTTHAELQNIDDNTFLGHRLSSGWAKEQEVYFALQISYPFSDYSLYEDTVQIEFSNNESRQLKAVISFDSIPNMVSLKVGISPVSSSNALENIKNEIPDWDFEKVVETAEKKWNDELSKITLKTNNLADKRNFYTSVYHSYIHPSLFNDYNGDYRGTDNKVYRNTDFNNYTILSTWDTYRAAHTLFTITQPDLVDDFVNTMLAINDQQGYLPIWHLNGYETKTMVGISSIQIVAEAYLKGINGFDIKRAYEAIKNTSNLDIEGLSYHKKLKPIPIDSDVRKTVAQAMELSISDGSTALMASSLGMDKDAEYFSKRSRNYQLYFDESTEFFRGIQSDSTWNPLFVPLSSKRSIAKDYAEGNAWQYLWLAPHDVSGLIETLGGTERFISRLDSFFTLDSGDEEVLVDLTGLIGQYAHGNEPSHHIAYLYAYAGQQWKTAEKVHYILKEFYKDQPAGIIGNEDAGQMSAWYIFSSMGFYPVFPASGNYVFGTPLFDEVSINIAGDKTFHVKAKNRSDKNIYIQSVTLNGESYSKTYISHNDIMAGGELVFEMGKTPNKAFGKAIDDRLKNDLHKE